MRPASLPPRLVHERLLLAAVDADQVHHAAAALLAHDGQRVLEAAYVAHEFQLQALLPRFLIECLDDTAGRRAGVVHQDIDAPEMLVRALDEVARIGFLGEVRRDREHLAAALLANLFRRRVERLLAPRAHRDVAAFARQSARDALADSFAAAGDERDLALELQVHSSSWCYILRSTSSGLDKSTTDPKSMSRK